MNQARLFESGLENRRRNFCSPPFISNWVSIHTPMREIAMMKFLKKHRGLTLVEALLFLGIAGVVIVGAVSLYNNASSNNKINEARGQIEAIVGGVKSLYETSPTYAGLSVGVVINAGVIPQNAVQGTTIIHPWADAVGVRPTGASAAQQRTFDIIYNNIPGEACIGLLTAGMLNEGAIVLIGANGTNYTVTPDAGLANTACNDATDNNDVLFRVR